MHLVVRHQAGEVSETAAGNVTSEFLAASLRESTNWWVTKDGMLKRRWGTAFVRRSWGDENGSANASFLFPFRSSDAAYVLEFAGSAGNRVRVRVWDEQGVMVSPAGTPPDTYTFLMPAAGTGYRNINYIEPDTISNLDVTAAGDEIYVFHRRRPIAVISYSPGGVFTASYLTLEGNPYLRRDIGQDKDNRVDGAGGFTSTSSRVRFSVGGNFAGLTVTAYEAKEINNVAILDFNLYPCKEEWIGKHVFLSDGTKHALIEITGILSADRLIGVVKQGENAVNPWTPSTIRFWSPVLGSACTIVFESTVSPVHAGDIGLGYMVDSGNLMLVSVVSAVSANCRVVRQGLVANAGAAAAGTTANQNNIVFPSNNRRWARPAWGNNTTATYTGAVETGWPALSEFWQGRLFAASSLAERQTIWASATQFLASFAPGPEPDAALQWEIASEENGEITALAAGSVLFIGTRTALYRATVAEGVSPENFRAVSSLGYGIARVKPVLAGAWFAMVRASGRAIMGIRYNDSIGIVEDEDMTRFASHLCDDGISQLAFSAYSDPRIIALRGNGKMASGTIVDSPVSPSWAGIDVGGHVESMCVMKGFSGDQIWLCVRRGNHRFIERMVEGRYLDSSLAASDVTIADEDGGVRVSGLQHLEGETITIMLEGSEYAGLAVSGGSVLVPVTGHASYEPFLAGLPFRSRIRPHRIMAQLRDGTDQMRKKRVVDVGCRVISTRKLMVRGYADGQEKAAQPFQFLRTNTPMDSMRAPFTGDIVANPASDYDTDGCFIIETDGPWDAAVTMIKAKIDFQDGQPNGTAV